MHMVNGLSDLVSTGAPVSTDARDTGDGEVCAACARQGKTCCQGHDIYLTHGDCRRISEYTGAVGFFEYRGCANAAYADQDDDPVWQRHVFRPDGTRRLLKAQSNGDCFFLSDRGCRLPLHVRPLICRLFPHRYTAESILTDWDSECPAVRATCGAALESRIAGVARDQAEQWHRLLYSEIIWEDLPDENRTDI
jgi:uncharacterized protein